MSIKERLIQVVLRGKDLLSPEAKKSRDALAELREEGEKLRSELDKAKADSGLVRSLTSLSKESARTEKELDRAKQNVEQLRHELDQSPGSRGLTVSLRSAETEARRAQRALDRVKQETAELASRAKEAGVDVGQLGAEEKRLAAELERAKKAVSSNAGETRRLQREQTAAARSTAEQESRTKSLRDALGSAEKRVLAYAAAYISLRTAMRMIGSVKNFFTDIFAGAAETEQKMAQLNATLQASGERAGWTAEQLVAMAAELRGSSMFTAEEIMHGQTKLLSYANIAGEELPRAMQLTIDFAERMGMTVEQAAERIGRSLNQPSSAMGVLGRRGFDLTKSQQELVKQLEATGRTAEAQAIVMDRLSETWGGAAAAARYETFAGLWRGITNRFEDFQGKVAESGAFQYITDALRRVNAQLDEMAEDGTLDRLAISISDAFVAGAEKVEELVRSLAKVDFKTLTDDASEFLSNFGSHLDAAAVRANAFFLPFKTGFKLLQIGFQTIAGAILELTHLVLSAAETMAAALPDMLGGDALVQRIESLKEAVAGTHAELLETNLATIESMKTDWAKALGHYEDTKEQEVAAARKAEKEKQAAAAATLRKQQEAAAEAVRIAEEAAAAEANAYRMAAVEGERAFQDIADALDVIETTSAVAELEQLRTTILAVGQSGQFTQQELDAAISKVSKKITELGKTATAGAKDLTTLEGALAAIETAANDIDVRQIKSALDKLYRDGKIGAEQHKQAQEQLNKKVAELKPVAETAAKAITKTADSNKKLADSADKADRSLRRVKRSTGAASGLMALFQKIVRGAQSRLEGLSLAALNAFNKLQDIKIKPQIDTSSIEGINNSIEAAQRALAGYQNAMDKSSSGFAKWQGRLLTNEKRIEVAFLQQKRALLELNQQYEKGAIGAAAFADAAAKMRVSANLLDSADLNQLDGAINSARQRMDQLRSSTQSTLHQLQDELLQLKGTQEEIEASRAAARKRELQEQLVEARKDGDSAAVANLQKALRTLSEIEDERARQTRNARIEEAAKKQQQELQQQPQTAAPAKVIKLQAAGSSVDVALGSEQDEAKLLSILEQYGMRTL